MENRIIRTPEQDSSEDFAAMFAESEARAGQVEEGRVVSGTVIQIAKDYVVVDIGYKSEGQVPLHEFIPLPGGNPRSRWATRSRSRESRENDTGMVVLSKEKADKMRIWDESPPRVSATSSSRA